ncbi:uncharacterized protein ACLA_059550 [Aspergillus clavatus NRRL 1]|uniref:Uncharacterized protein n=1 Tax=Aspergillus clavatus (strain ATCC 1007 / CBS 513.65 / DSM 816 / NCTC 3887 / NRRL 1 / QM 1276 / 107) TaxID=344612 RepID=A1C4E8_ASPCL|nr:uncharacterized protein ACLA_059550 [Aspergillus clavatus NRRL 1]EAW15288.1 conserved hypothetical protein [Aspergillus clavatus NRRL 1]
MPKQPPFTIYEAPDLHDVYLSFRPSHPKGPALAILKACLAVLEKGKARIDRTVSFPFTPKVGDLVLEMKTVSGTDAGIIEESKQFIRQQIDGFKYDREMVRWYRYEASEGGFGWLAYERL